MSAVIKNIQVFKAYFSGAITIEDVDKHFNLYKESYINFERDLYSTLINSNDELRDEVIDLLLHLNINFNLWGSYFSQDLNVYNFLKELAKDHENHTQLNQLIDLIAKKKWRGLWELAQSLAIAAVFILPVLAVLLSPVLSLMYDFLFKTANFLPILGIIFSCSTLIFNIYLNHLNDRRPSFKIYRDDIFLLISSTLGIAGKITLIVAKSTLASFASVLFIAAALVDTIKELFYLLELRKNYLKKPTFSDNDQAIIHQQYTRHEYDYLKQRNTLIINFVSALALTALVITCTFFPVGIILTLSTCASIASVYLIKKLFLMLNEHLIATKLQTELKNIGEQYQTAEVDESSFNQLRSSLRLDDGITSVTAKESVLQEQNDTVNKFSFRHYQTVRLGQSSDGFFKKPLAERLANESSKEIDATQESSSCFSGYF